MPGQCAGVAVPPGVVAGVVDVLGDGVAVVAAWATTKPPATPPNANPTATTPVASRRLPALNRETLVWSVTGMLLSSTLTPPLV